ncbi:cytochrome P450 family protein [Rhizoctonia solani]|uniref:Cytochrome P450 family protein n=1 Tax=Rhizoctonia solani TaxID=456999 RepID=A0A8H8SXB1_9AGAM|nr:cytochrome P450 family protein [Rhizoctonia solani]QRW21194.1 cytochrome P450 family protein [Rhizoctonia solani]
MLDYNIPAHYYVIGVFGTLAAYVFIPYLTDPHGLRRNTIAGPKLAALSNVWLAYVASRGTEARSFMNYTKDMSPFSTGKVVRIAPNHISIADPKALEVVYAHGNGTLKTEFYDAFVSIRPGLFNTRDRAAHTRKRKLVSHIFSQQNVLLFEPHVRRHVRAFCAQWDMRCARATAGELPDAHNGKSWFDVLPHFNFLAFDIIGDLAFGAPFGMIAAQKDIAPMMEHAGEKAEVKYVPAVQVLNDRGDYSASMGVLPMWIRPIMKYVPWFSRGNTAVQCLAGMAIAAVERRLKFGLPDEPLEEEEEIDEKLSKGKKRTDLLEKLMQGKDENGAPMGREELTAEALTQLIAGSDTTSNSSCAIAYYLAANPECQRKLQAELDKNLKPVISSPPSTSQSGIPPLPPSDVAARFADVKSLSYLQACVNEGLRLHSTSGIGLPRVIPQGSTLEVCGETFNEGTILSVPSYTIHHSQEIWGDDANDYRPERWFEREVGKEFNPFSFGPRACVGRNLASMELLIIIASVFHRYEFELSQPNQKLYTREGFLRKPLECVLGVKRRDINLP